MKNDIQHPNKNINNYSNLLPRKCNAIVSEANIYLKYIFIVNVILRYFK